MVCRIIMSIHEHGWPCYSTVDHVTPWLYSHLQGWPCLTMFIICPCTAILTMVDHGHNLCNFTFIVYYGQNIVISWTKMVYHGQNPWFNHVVNMVNHGFSMIPRTRTLLLSRINSLLKLTFPSHSLWRHSGSISNSPASLRCDGLELKSRGRQCIWREEH